MSTVWRNDTLAILADGGGKTVTVKTSIVDFVDGFSRFRNDVGVWSGTVIIFLQRAGRLKDDIHDTDGKKVESTHNIFFPYTSTVSVGSRVFESGETDYYEVLTIGLFEDHKEISAKKVENR